MDEGDDNDNDHDEDDNDYQDGDDSVFYDNAGGWCW